MRTLNEVILDFESCNGHCGNGCKFNGAYGCNVMYQLKEDVLYHMKAYQLAQEELEESTRYFVSQNTQKMENKSDSITEMESNDALTWDELKQMQGKPVWVEIGSGWKGWVIIRKITNTGIVSGSDGFIGIDSAYGMDTTWQAYRKERS